MRDYQGLTTRYGDPITPTAIPAAVHPKKPGRFILRLNEPELANLSPALLVLYAGHHDCLLEFSDGAIYNVDNVQSSHVEGFLSALLYSASADAQRAALDHARRSVGYVWVVDDVSAEYRNGTAFKTLLALTKVVESGERLLAAIGQRDYLTDLLVILAGVSDEARLALGLAGCLSDLAYQPVQAPPLPDVPGDQLEQAQAASVNPDSVIPYSLISANALSALDCLRLAANLPLCIEVASGAVYRVATVPMDGDAGPFLGADTTEPLSDAAYHNAQQVIEQLPRWEVARCRIRAADELSYQTLFFRLIHGADHKTYPRLTDRDVAELKAAFYRQVVAETNAQTTPTPATQSKTPATPDYRALHADSGAAFDAIYGIKLPLGYSVANRCGRTIHLDFPTPQVGEPMGVDGQPDRAVLSVTEKITVVLEEGGGAFTMRSPVDSFPMTYMVCQDGGAITTRSMRLGSSASIEFSADAQPNDIQAAVYTWLYRQYAHRDFDVPR